MTLLIPWLFLAIILVAAAGIFLLTSRRSRQAGQKRLQKPLAPVFKEEFSAELQPVPAIPAPGPSCRPAGPDLPLSYGVDRLVLMARDPHWLFAYWEITATKQEEFKTGYGPAAWTETRNYLRVYDVTGVGDFDGRNANSYVDIPVSEEANNWHIHVGEPDRSFCVDLGRMFPDGQFVPLLRSNIVTTPRASLSDRLDEEWMWIEGLYLRHQMGVSSPLIVEEMKERMGIVPLGISSPGFSPGFYKREYAEDND